MTGISFDDPKVILAVLQILSQGGLGLTIFVIWYFTYKSQARERQEAQEQQRAALQLQNNITAEAFKKHTVLSESLIQILKDEQDYKVLLTGVIERMEQRVSTPCACPLLIPGKKIKVEVTE